MSAMNRLDVERADAADAMRWLLHARSFSVIPLHYPSGRHDGKAPKIQWQAFQAARPSEDQLQAWCARGPINLAIVTGAISGVVVVDGDSPEALDWMRAHLPPTEMRTRTAKGEHWYYRHPGGRPIPNRARLRGGLIDVRGDGGYVVAPPSRHASGVRYERLGAWPPVSALPIFDPAWLEAA